MPRIFRLRRMWREAGGREQYLAMPVREAQEMELSMMAEDAWRVEQWQEQQRKNEEHERDMERQMRKR